jgi:hypothetical protein
LPDPLPGARQAAVDLCPNSSLAHEVVAGLESLPIRVARPRSSSRARLIKGLGPECDLTTPGLWELGVVSRNPNSARVQVKEVTTMQATMFSSRLGGGLHEKEVGCDSRAERPMIDTALMKAIGAGLLGGLVATLVLDVIVVGLFPFIGMPADISFSIIGDTAARFFAMLDIEMAGGVPLGLLVHYLTGLALGGLFGAAASRHDILRLDAKKNCVRLGSLYTEIVSFPILATAPIMLQMSAPSAAQWFGVSFVMHAVYGSVLAFVVSRLQV